MPRAPRKQWSHSQSDRCPVWEKRYVRDDDNSVTRTRPMQVRCSEPKNTEHVHAWRGIPFGVLDKPVYPAGPYCGVVTRDTGEECRQPTRGGVCYHHRDL